MNYVVNINNKDRTMLFFSSTGLSLCVLRKKLLMVTAFLGNFVPKEIDLVGNFQKKKLNVINKKYRAGPSGLKYHVEG